MDEKRLKIELKQRYGIIDIGSNTIRLVIYETGTSKLYHELENTKVTARLRSYLEDGILNEAGIQLLILTLQQFQESTRFYGLKHVICMATATVRQAKNQSYIQQLVEEHTDFKLRILSEYEEAYYGYLAIINSTSFEEGITIDIGGGSTELTYFKNRQLVEYYSFPFGALSLKQQFIEEDVPTAEEKEKLYSYVKSSLETLPWLLGKEVPIIAIGGSARNMAKIHQQLISYSISSLHLYEMNAAHIDSVKQHLSSLSFSELQKQDGLARDRADTILPAIEVFGAIMHLSNAPSFVLSRKGLREGVFYEALTKPFHLSYYPNVVEESLHMLAQEYGMDMDYVMQLMINVSAICNELERLGVASFSEEELQLLRKAAKVFNIGKYIDEESSSQHTFYLLANKTIDGMMHKERIQLALLASYKSRSAFKRYMQLFDAWFSKEEQRQLSLLGSILQLAAALNITNRNFVKNILIEERKEDLQFFISCRSSGLAERMQAEKQKKPLEKALKRNIELNFLIN